ncbi:pyroglutamyl-peptidase I [Methylovirgula sp. 4M-Z18]|uniref:pyroglutamyl-peptidase I n=1 Tax=Methylovirgula sp. 4M-Z18 TaxID=2293567 RepID=UPI000E2F01BC|nr:pyroglutamyl-peptidase I [Methylovirgula sp. 4M-Z18]RFB75019.1 pyroglutamyl-peptidase I [Methylovirgula sp. 4M-Z18]
MQHTQPSSPYRTILVTGFEPFGGETINPSWEAARQLDGWVYQGAKVVARQMPCVFGAAYDALAAALREVAPQIVICVGQASNRSDFSVERIAINIDDARIPDNAGRQPVDVPVVADGPAAYFSSLPIKAIVQAVRAAGIPASMSQTAGTYVCNHLFYAACHLRATRYDGLRKAGFIHVPLSPEQAAHHAGHASMSIDTVARALRVTVETCLKRDADVTLAAGQVS